ncbi:hypothetical protein P879_03684 [Paragonimus westermani]|uniref:Uncharacterized protein n=1 Tax=Paragonimus westermani TaxID=34504 RepID=A0A8T0DWZ5_9TREM|nr:hypothetical protein P879_03684 [Paragonimus westermani]
MEEFDCEKGQTAETGQINTFVMDSKFLCSLLAASAAMLLSCSAEPVKTVADGFGFIQKMTVDAASITKDAFNQSNVQPVQGANPSEEEIAAFLMSIGTLALLSLILTIWLTCSLCCSFGCGKLNAVWCDPDEKMTPCDRACYLLCGCCCKSKCCCCDCCSKCCF